MHLKGRSIELYAGQKCISGSRFLYSYFKRTIILLKRDIEFIPLQLSNSRKKFQETHQRFRKFVSNCHHFLYDPVGIPTGIIAVIIQGFDLKHH